MFALARPLFRKQGPIFTTSRLRLLQGKIKMLVSFFQVAATFEIVYGIQLHDNLKSMLNFMKYFNFDFFDWTFDLLRISSCCIWGKGTKYSFTRILLFTILVLLVAVFMIMAFCCKCSPLAMSLWPRLLYLLILIVYLQLPGISRDLSNEDAIVSFTVVSVVAWGLVIFSLLLFLCLLVAIRKSVRSGIISPLAKACRLLWQDYRPPIYFWEIVDVLRKIFLAGVMAVLPRCRSQTGYYGYYIERNIDYYPLLAIATLISCFYTIMLAFFRPYAIR